MRVQGQGSPGLTDGQVILRKFPFPYRAGLAICSDLDGQLYNVKRFLALRQFLNTDGPTSLGEGLGLEIGDSFWMYSHEPYFTYFKTLTQEKAAAAKIIGSFARAGYLDVLHTYGNFEKGGFRRDLAQQAIAEMAQEGLAVKVWVDHGNFPNVQNLRYEGANPHSPYYHADLLIPSGIRFIWTERVVDCVGQDAQSSHLEPEKGNWGPLFRRTIRSLASRPLETMHQLRTLGSLFSKIRHMVDNSLIAPRILPDGQKVYEFVRFNGSPAGVWGHYDAQGLRYSLSPENLEILSKKQGYTVIYTHLAKSYPHPEAELPFEPEDICALRQLADRNRRGEIWVTTTSRLLTYRAAVQALSWRTVRDDEGITRIIIEPGDDPVGDKGLPVPDDLQGITFYLPFPEKVRIFLGQQEVKPIQPNPPDHTGCPSVTIPLRPLVFPEVGLD